jgi:serine/threonine protein kinase
MAVIFYEVLFGLPPFSATYGDQYTDCDTIPDKIQNGLFPHGSKSKYITSLPKWHNNFQLIPEPLKMLFLKAFEEGHHKPNDRPSAETWGQVLYREITQLQTSKPYQIKKTTPKEQPLTRVNNYFNNLIDRTNALYSRMALLMKNAFSSLSSSLLTIFNNYFN